MPLRIGQDAVLHHLKQDTRHVGMRLFDLVKEHDRVGTASKLLCELTALLVPDISGGRADEACDAVLFHIFRHIESDHCVFRSEKLLGKDLGQLGFPNPRWPEKEKGADWATRILHADAAAPNGARKRRDRLLLTDNSP